MVSVKVSYRSTGKPAKSKRAALGFSGFRGMSSAKYTDSNGEAHFNVNPGQGKVYVGGKNVYEGYLSGMVVVYI